jgi:hypothetical protein
MVPYPNSQESVWYTVNLEAINSSVIRDKFVQLEKENDSSLLYTSQVGFFAFYFLLQQKFYLLFWYYNFRFNKPVLRIWYPGSGAFLTPDSGSKKIDTRIRDPDPG